MHKKRKLKWGRIIFCCIVIVGSVWFVKNFDRELLFPKETLPMMQANQGEDPLILVNQDHELPDDYQVELSSFDGYEIATAIRSSLEEMYQAARRNGVTLHINNAYRSVAVQQEVFDQKLAYYQQLGYDAATALEKTKAQVQEPGYSEHHTGYAIDFSKENDSVSNEQMWAWLNKHASQYGFILRYSEACKPITKIEYEPWHYRYVGTEAAQTIVKQNLCFEEYIQLYGKD